MNYQRRAWSSALLWEHKNVRYLIQDVSLLHAYVEYIAYRTV
jgi:hypothetical protein